jgi:hypothetical protein
MTDQDPTQRYEPPTFEPPAAPPGSPAASGLASAPTGLPADADPVATTPVSAATSSRGASRLRWLAVAVLVLVVGGVAAAATALLTADSGDPDVLQWTPADSLAYGELRLDLPGTQQAELAKVMSAFPGFDDQAAFPTKVNEVMDQLVGRVSDGTQSWSDIDPWFGRQLAASVGPLPATRDPSEARGLVLVSVTDAAKAEAWAAGIVADKGAATTTEVYGGTTITVVTLAASSGDAGHGMKQAAYAVVGPVLAVGDLASVKAAIDTEGTKGLNTVTRFQDAESSVSGDRLAFSYVDVQGVADGVVALAGPAASAMPRLPEALENLAVPWAVSAVRAEDGAFVVETRTPHVQAMGPAKASSTTLASVLPPTTILLAEGHDLGEALTRARETANTEPEIAEGLKQLDQGLSVVGGWDAVVGWMGEGGVAITRDGDTVGGGLVITPTDPEAASQLVTKIRGLLGLAGGQAGITVTEEPYGDTTISVVHLGNLGGMTGLGNDLPSDATISFAATDQVVVLGYGTDFTKAVLDARNGASLAQTERFSSALAQAGTAHSALGWVDVIGLRGLVETHLPAEDKARYEADAKPYLEAFDSVIAIYAPGDDLDRGTVIIRVTGD